MIAPPNIYPLHYGPRDMDTWAQSPQLASMIWLRERKTVAPDLIWYAVGMKITSPLELTLYVYEMECSFRGGIGKQVFEHEVKVEDLTESEQMMFCQVVLTEYTAYADRELERRDEEERQKRVIALRKELFGC